MDMVELCSDLERLGPAHVMVTNKGAFAEGRTRLENAKVSERFVNYYGPFELHFARNPEFRAEFVEDIGRYSGKMEYSVIVKTPDNEDVVRVTMLRPDGAEEHEPERMAIWQEIKARYAG